MGTDILEQHQNVHRMMIMESSPEKCSVKENAWRRRSLVRNLSMDFCVNSSLHGLKYIGERRQHFVERWVM